MTTTPPMKPEVKTLWLEALRSGEYKQTDGHLTRLDRDNEPIGHCCLGVLCEVAIKQGIDLDPQRNADGTLTYGRLGSNLVLPHEVQAWAGLDCANPAVPTPEDIGVTAKTIDLAELNDDHKYTFAMLADLIEENL